MIAPFLFSKITSVQSYGAFIEIIGFRKQGIFLFINTQFFYKYLYTNIVSFYYLGLLHISQISSYKVEHVEDVLALNESVWVR